MLALLALALGACGKMPAAEGGAGADTAPEKLVQGYVPAEIPYPEWLARTGRRDCVAWQGDRICVAGIGPDDRPVFGYYDTIGARWQQLPLDCSAQAEPEIRALSAAPDAIWLLLRDFDRAGDEAIWYLWHCTPDGADGVLSRIDFYGGGESSEGRSLYSEFTGLLALGTERALLFDNQGGYAMDGQGNRLELAVPEGLSADLLFEANGKRLYYCYGEDHERLISLDPETLTPGPELPVVSYGSFSSQRGRYLCSYGDALCEYDPESGGTTPIFSWLEAALRADETGNYGCLENSAGDFFFAGNGRFVRVRPTMVRPRETLRMAVFADTSAPMYAYWQRNGHGDYFISDDLKNAVLRFNNTDPDYRIELVPTAYGSEQERDRALIELTMRSDLDLIDTSLLPERALDSRMLTDLLPLLDADGELGREDFLPGLLSAMLRGGGLYEYVDRYALLGLAVAADCDPGADNWTVENLLAGIAAHPERAALDPNLSRDELRELFLQAGTAEFIDWDAGAARFDDGRYEHWLELLAALPLGGEWTDSRVLTLSGDLSAELAFGGLRGRLNGDFRFCGFPEAQESGCYWRLPPSVTDLGASSACTRVGILASCTRPEAAWRFVRCLILSTEPGELYEGIPACRSVFEAQLAAAAGDEDMPEPMRVSEADLVRLRALAEGTRRAVRADPELLAILRGEADAFLAGQCTAAEAAARSQSRVSVYVSEQGA